MYETVPSNSFFLPITFLESSSNVQWPDLKLHAGVIKPGTRILDALSFPLDKGNEGSEEEREKATRLWGPKLRGSIFCYTYFVKM